MGFDCGGGTERKRVSPWLDTSGRKDVISVLIFFRTCLRVQIARAREAMGEKGREKLNWPGHNAPSLSTQRVDAAFWYSWHSLCQEKKNTLPESERRGIFKNGNVLGEFYGRDCSATREACEIGV
jgi:hypothetical protein